MDEPWRDDIMTSSPNVQYRGVALPTEYSWDKIVTKWFSYVVSDLRNPQVLLRHNTFGYHKS